MLKRIVGELLVSIINVEWGEGLWQKRRPWYDLIR